MTERRGLSRKDRKKRRLTYGLACLIVVIVIASFYFLWANPQTPFVLGGKKAAIIDGLSTTQANVTFWQTARDMLEQAGYETYYYQGGADTIDFYRNLAKQGFQIIIIRVHSALNPENGDLALFTNEKWDDDASTTYLDDLIYGRLAQVRVYENSPSFFGITPNFIRDINQRFENTIVIMMGCDGLKTNNMAEAFIQKGAKTYIAWNGPVTPEYMDGATTKLLEHLVLEKQAIPQAISNTMNETGPDPSYQSELTYYPQS
jgi:hypothetical protein